MIYTAFPKQHGKRIRTTNMMKGVNKEIKRRTEGETIPIDQNT